MANNIELTEPKHTSFLRPEIKLYKRIKNNNKFF